MNETILVTGVTGTIGGFVADQLSQKKVPFKVLVRDPKKLSDLQAQGVEVLKGDFKDPDSIQSALKGIGKLFLVSATSPEIPELQGNVVDAANKMGVSHIVKISAMGAAMESKIGIARYHAQVENHILQSGIPYTNLRPHSFMQNLIFDAGTIREENAIYAQMGDGKISMVDARDIAAVAVKALTETGHENKTYTLTGPESLSYHELADLFSNILERTIRYVPVTSVNARSAMLESGMPGWLVEDLVELNKDFSLGAGDVIFDDVKEVTGRNAFTYSDFIKDFIHIFK